MPPSDGDEPVALAVGGGGHADDGLVEVHGAGRAVEGGVAEGEDAAVTGDEPVALAVGRGGHADDGLVQVDGAGRAVELGVAVGEDAAVTGDEPVALSVGGGGHADDRLGEVQTRKGRRPERGGATVRHDVAQPS